MASDNSNSVLVIMGASRSAKLMPRYLDQLQQGGIPFHIESLPDIQSPSDGTLGWCARKWSDLAERFEQYERLVLTDAWDVLFFSDHDTLCDRLSLFAPHVLFAGERNCYPEPFLADAISRNYKPTPQWPWRFLNGGCLTASPDELWRWCREVERHPEYQPGMIGQQWLNRRMAEGSMLARIDQRTELFYCLYREDEGNELTVKDGKPFNSLTGASPCFLHWNGSWPTEPFLRMLEDAKEKANA